ncbi:uncharacterized protein LOC115562594 isoform X1 [Drosophila navojoa]|uniref:uncharacterized protein LOC115562594 isoform X1 n=1 Tax=Drosophila navojoa TaxID=7232 RepID=UPI0011BEAAA6|nr:uncharacterized protein LOC115562594 isoform X1 [Drosophila navojoa]
MAALAILMQHISLICVSLLIKGALCRNVDVKEFPYLGTLRNLKMESEAAGSGYVCAATLIHNRVFITSGECIHGKRPEDLIVVVGTTLIRGLPKTILVLRIEYMRLHGLYVHKKHDYNIGLIFTSEDTPPIKNAIGYAPLNKKKIPPHTRCHIIGWGVAADVSILTIISPIL